MVGIDTRAIIKMNDNDGKNNNKRMGFPVSTQNMATRTVPVKMTGMGKNRRSHGPFAWTGANRSITWTGTNPCMFTGKIRRQIPATQARRWDTQAATPDGPLCLTAVKNRTVTVVVGPGITRSGQPASTGQSHRGWCLRQHQSRSGRKNSRTSWANSWGSSRAAK